MTTLSYCAQGALCLYLMMITLQTPLAQNYLPAYAGPRGAALGGVGVTFTDTGSPLSNQAGMAFCSLFSAAVSAEQPFLLPDIRQLNATVVYPIKQGTLGFSVQHLGLKAYREQRLGVAYGRLLTANTAMGVQINAQVTSIPEYGYTFTPNMDIGIQSKIFETTRFGAHLSNPFHVKGRLGRRLPGSLRTGLEYQPSDKVSYFLELEKDIDYPLRVKAGLEYQPAAEMFIRIGASTNPAQASLGTAFSLPNGLHIDIGTKYQPRLGISPSFGITYTKIASQ